MMKFLVDVYNGARKDGKLVFGDTASVRRQITTTLVIGSPGFEKEFTEAILDWEYPCDYATREKRFAIRGTTVELIMDISHEQYRRMCGRDEDDVRPPKIFKAIAVAES